MPIHTHLNQPVCKHDNTLNLKRYNNALGPIIYTLYLILKEEITEEDEIW
jgi:hypothetical protein